MREAYDREAHLKAMETLSCEDVDSDEPTRADPVYRMEGCDRAAVCRWSGTTIENGHIECEETADSKHRTLKKVVVDRLALETNCPAPGIHVDGESSWSRGDEHAYRMTACGSTYVCTTAAGRTDCKASLALPGTAPAAARR